ncbi:MAG: hypothetical protein TREMPRED_005332 [Tremellales sp. Tagirdzhanova-0007]|nr:MAG: hypothetical protein TREMPRED_005332 [Tremellales sp. Tagirdzhanova-0007]
MPHIASTMLNRNRFPHASRNRINKHVDQIILGNPCGDAISDIRWRYNTTCVDQPAVLDEDICLTMRDTLPECLDALDYAYLDSTVESRLSARRLCFQEDAVRFEKACFPPPTCMDWYDPLDELMNSEYIRAILGVPSEIEWQYMNAGGATAKFIANADNMQGAYRLLTPVLEAGTRLLGDTTASLGRSFKLKNIRSMERLSSPHLASFRSTPFRNVSCGRIKGDDRLFNLLLIDDGGHVAIMKQPALLQKLVGQGVRGEKFELD